MKLHYFLCALLVCSQQTLPMEETLPKDIKRKIDFKKIEKDREAGLTRAVQFLQASVVLGIVAGIGIEMLSEAYKESKAPERYSISVEESADFDCELEEIGPQQSSEPVDMCNFAYGCATKLKPAECKGERGLSFVFECPKNSDDATKLLLEQLKSEKTYHCVSRVGVNTVIAIPMKMPTKGFLKRLGHKQSYR